MASAPLVRLGFITETSVVFEFIGSRYERRSMLSNQSFGEWGKVFPEPTLS
jgi:DNA replication protein DnaC